MPGGLAMIAALVFEPSGFGWPGGLAVLAGTSAVVAAYAVGLKRRQHPPGTRIGLLGLRLGAIFCLVLSLLHPTWVSERSASHKPVVAVVVDDSESMGLAAGIGGGQDERGPSRYARAIEVLGHSIVPGLQDKHRLWVFDVEGRSVALEHLPPAPTDGRSPLTDTLLRVQQELAASNPNELAGIVLLSDGAETTDQPAVGGIEQLRVPVYAIEVAGPAAKASSPPDLSIQAVSANRRAIIGNTVQVMVDMVAEGEFPATSVPVSILDGEKTVVTRAVQWRPGDTAIRAELEFVPYRAGDFTYTVQADSLPGEVNLKNNRQTFPLAVRAKALTVLYVDGVLRWEGKFIREALGGDPDINIIMAVRTAVAGGDRGSQGLLLAVQLANVNLVMLGDVEASYFSSEELKALRTWVTDKGGAILLTGGYHSFGPEGFGRTDLGDVLPVEFSTAANPQIEQPFNLKLTEAGLETSIFHLTGDRVRDAAFFQSLPQLSGCSRIAAVKPGAQVLAINPSISGPEAAQGLPVMVAQQVGSGRTMVFAVDTTWRWRMVVGGYTGDTGFYRRFWGQLVRWMVALDEQVPRQLVVSTDRHRYKPGDSIELSIAVGRPAASGPAGLLADAAATSRGTARVWRVAAQTLDEKGNRTNVPLADLGGLRYRGTVGASRPGRMDLLVTAEPTSRPAEPKTGSADKSQSQVVTVEVDPVDLEMLDPRPNPQWLARVAQMSGGRSLKPDQIAAWAKQLPAGPIEIRSPQTAALWHHPALASTFFGLLCAEWILRRRSRLA